MYPLSFKHSVSHRKTKKKKNPLVQHEAIWRLCVLLSLIANANATFFEIPEDQIVLAGGTAKMRCRHNTADTLRWRKDGVLISDSNFPPGISQSFISRGRILAVEGRPEYNGTAIQCVARFDSGASDESSDPPAILQVINLTATTAVTEVTETTSAGSLSGFDETPVSLNVTVGAESHFTCRYPESHRILWSIDGTFRSNLPASLSNLVQVQDPGETIVVTADPQFNMSSIQCVATFVGGTDIHAPPVTLLIQGPLDTVKQLRKEDSTLSWDPPFSLDLTNIDPDIVYCVEVYNITCGERELVISDCNVTENNYTSDAIAPDRYIYEYIVTPRSNVESAPNGTSFGIRDHFLVLDVATSSLSTSDTAANYHAQFTSREVDMPVPSSVTFSLEPLDGLGPATPDVVWNKEDLSISVPQLERKRLWRCYIRPYNCSQDNSIVKPEELSTHDIKKISTSFSQPGEVRVNGDIVEGSAATGVLLVFFSQKNSEINYVYLNQSFQKSIDIGVTGLTGTEYSVSTFALVDGLPFSRVVELPVKVMLSSDTKRSARSVVENNVKQTWIEYFVDQKSSPYGVCINCTFLNSSATDCVAVVHHRISQLNSSGLMNINSSYSFTRSGDTASGCIGAVDLDYYQVGVMGGRKIDVPTPASENSSCAYIYCVVMPAVGVVLLLLVLVVVLAGVLAHHQWREKKKMQVNIRASFIHHSEEGRSANHYQLTVADKRRSSGVPLYEAAPLLQSSTSRSPEHESFSITTGRRFSCLVFESPHGKKQPLVYADLETVKRPGFIRAPPMVEKGNYSDVTGYKNQEDQTYALVSRDHSNPHPDLQPTLEDRNKVVYSELQLQETESITPVVGKKQEDGCPQQTCPAPPPFTSESLLSLLYPVVSKWRELGDALGVDEDDVDEIDTANEYDEGCLIEMLERFVVKYHNWESVVSALRKIDEHSLANDIEKKHVLPYAPSQCSDPIQESNMCSEGAQCQFSDLTQASCTCCGESSQSAASTPKFFAQSLEQTSFSIESDDSNSVPVPELPDREVEKQQPLVYADLETMKRPGFVVAPPVVQKGDYSDVACRFKNPKGQSCTLVLSDTSTPHCDLQPTLEDRNKVVYSLIQPQKVKQNEHVVEKNQEDNCPQENYSSSDTWNSPRKVDETSDNEVIRYVASDYEKNLKKYTCHGKRNLIPYTVFMNSFNHTHNDLVQQENENNERRTAESDCDYSELSPLKIEPSSNDVATEVEENPEFVYLQFIGTLPKPSCLKTVPESEAQSDNPTCFVYLTKESTERSISQPELAVDCCEPNFVCLESCDEDEIAIEGVTWIEGKRSEEQHFLSVDTEAPIGKLAGEHHCNSSGKRAPVQDTKAKSEMNKGTKGHKAKIKFEIQRITSLMCYVCEHDQFEPESTKRAPQRKSGNYYIEVNKGVNGHKVKIKHASIAAPIQMLTSVYWCDLPGESDSEDINERSVTDKGVNGRKAKFKSSIHPERSFMLQAWYSFLLWKSGYYERDEHNCHHSKEVSKRFKGHKAKMKTGFKENPVALRSLACPAG